LRRNLTELSSKEYDLLVIGGGINGVCTAWDAALRGLSVALVEKGDFGGATSSATLRILHGGLRYLQNLDFKRMRRCIRERTTLMRIAPHLVHPIPFLVPTYGHGKEGMVGLAAATLINDLMGYDRNPAGQDDPQKFIPSGRLISRYRTLRILPGLHRERLTGGAIFYDAQVYNSERLTLSFARSAAEAGADLANYAEVVGFVLDGRRVRWTKVRDVLKGEEFEVQAKVIVNATGPWSDIVLGFLRYRPPDPACGGVIRYKGIQVVAPLFCEKYAFAIPGQQREADVLISRGRRPLIFMPWHGRSLIGTSPRSRGVYVGDPDDFSVTERDIERLIVEINASYPGARLTRQDTSFWYGGLCPVTEKNVEGDRSRAARKSEICDHWKRDRVQGLVTALGANYTTCRFLAEKVVDLIFRKLGYREPPRSLSRSRPVFGGKIDAFNDFLGRAIREKPDRLNEKTMRRLVYDYGSEYPRVLRYVRENRAWGETIPGTDEVLKAEVVHAVREEMACRLTDVVMRRTDLGCLGHPGEPALRACAQIMAAELGWDESRRDDQLSHARKLFVPGEGR